jgi:hypothetical protein
MRPREIRRRTWGWGLLERLLQDLRFALRMVAKSPAASLGLVLILALGIGAGTALFSVVDGAFLHPLAYRDPHRFVVLNQDFPRQVLKSWFFSLRRPGPRRSRGRSRRWTPSSRSTRC